VRAADGLALSSRNGFLTAEERAEAPRLYRLLRNAHEQIINGAHDYQRIELEAMAELAHHGWHPDYVAVRRQSDLQPLHDGEREIVVVAAARLGSTRLIDNVEVLRT
jgi:pantoate--beta-alanine ligase